MKFVYQYRTRDNAVHDGVVSASNRDAAFRQLKAEGIRPCRLDEDSGFLNKLIGKGKRWLAIFFLAVVLIAVLISWSVEAERAESDATWTHRQQIYGDQGVIRAASVDGWAPVFPMAGDRVLARYAIPGVKVEPLGDGREDALAALLACLDENIEMAPEDLSEVSLMKKIVNGMKRELRVYLKDGGSVSGYLDRLDMRQRTENGVYERIAGELNANPGNEKLWFESNKSLRAMGLPMVPVLDE